MPRFVLLATLVISLSAPFLVAEDNWPQFRGGPAAGVAGAKGLPTTWSATQNVAWSVEIPGRGWSSPIVWGDKVFVTTAVKDGDFEKPGKGLYLGGERKAPSEVVRWKVYCLDARSGKVLWEKLAHEEPPKSSVHVKNTYASETPLADGERVFAYFGHVGLFCYDMEGKELWSQKWGSFKTNFGWGPAASPVLHIDRIYVVNDNEERSSLTAIDKKTGKEIWRVQRAEKSNWATPFVWENAQRTEIVTPGSGKVRSYDLDGKLLWELSGMAPIVIPTPSSASGLLYVSSGHVVFGQLWPIYAIRPGAAGDITLKDGETSNSYIAWSHKKAGPYHPSPIVYEGRLYVLNDRGFLACYDATTGKEIYEKQRLGGAFTASPWIADGKIFCLNEDGDTFVVQTGPEFKVLGKNRLDEMCMATPAVTHGSLFVRTMTKLYRISEMNGK
jgi:outer membrane protein assembly factor BamB